MPSYAIKSSGIRQVAANSLIGNSTGSTGSAEELSATDAKTLLGLGTSDAPTFAGQIIKGTAYIQSTGGATRWALQGNANLITQNSTGGPSMGGTVPYSFVGDTSTGIDSDGSGTLLLIPDTNAVEQRNSTNAQSFRIYNTDDGSQTNYERGIFDWSTTSNVLTIGTEAAGTGTQRSVKVTGGGYTVIQGASGSELHQGGSRVLRCSGAAYFYKSAEPIGTINLGGSSSRWANVYATNADLSEALTLTAHTPATTTNKLYNVSGSLYFNGSAVGGSSNPFDQDLNTTDSPTFASATIGNMTLSDAGSYDSITSGDARLALRAQDGSMELYMHNKSDGNDSFRFNTANGIFELFSDADNQIDLRNGTSPNTLNIFNTFSDSSNNEYGACWWDTNIFRVGTYSNGTGSGRDVYFQRDNSTYLHFDSSDIIAYRDILSNGNNNLGDSSGNHVGNIYASNLYNSSGGGRIQLGGSDTIFYQAIRMQGAADYLGFDQGGKLYGDGAGTTISQRNGTNAQIFRIYNTDDGSQTNYERLSVGWSGNDAIIGTEKAGTGAARTLQFKIAGINKLELTGTWIDLRGSCKPDTDGTRWFGDSTKRWALGYWGGNTVTTSTPIFDGTQTWNDAGVEFTGINVDITNTASLSHSKLLDLKVGGSRIFGIDRTGDWQLPDSFNISLRSNSRGQRLDIHINGIRMRNVGALSWTDSTKTDGNEDLFLLRDGAGILAQRNGGSEQRGRWYNSWSSASNNEYLEAGFDTNIAYLRTVANGTGLDRDLELSPATGNVLVPATGKIAFSTRLTLNGSSRRLMTDNSQTLQLQGSSFTTSQTVSAVDIGGNFTDADGDQKVLSLTPTYNQTGTAGSTDLLINRTETAVGSGSHYFADFQVGGTSKFKVDNAGSAYLDNIYHSSGGGRLQLGSSGYTLYAELSCNRLLPRADGTYDLGAETLAWNNIKNTGSILCYNGGASDSTNYERGFLEWDSNVFTIGTQAAGTGTDRGINFVTGGTTRGGFNTSGKLQAGSKIYLHATATSNQPYITNSADYLAVSSQKGFLASHFSDRTSGDVHTFTQSSSSIEMTDTDGPQSFMSITPRVGQSGTAAYNGLKIDITESSLGDGSTGDGNNAILATVGGISKFKVSNAGMITTAGGNGSGTAGGLMLGNSIGWISRGTGSVELASGAAEYVEIASDGITLRTGNSFGWSSNNNPQDSAGPRFWENTSTETIELRRGATSLGFAVANTWTDASNLEFGVFDWTTTSNVLTIGTQAAGTGTVRDLVLATGGTETIKVAGSNQRVTISADRTAIGSGSSHAGVLNLGGDRVLTFHGGNSSIRCPSGQLDFRTATSVFTLVGSTIRFQGYDGGGFLNIRNYSTGGAGTVVIRKLASQTSDLLKVLDDSGNNLFNLQHTGDFVLGSNSTTNPNIYSYGLFTDNSNYERLKIEAGTAYNIRVQAAGTGTGRDLNIHSGASAALRLGVDGTNYIIMTSSGVKPAQDLFPNANNSYKNGTTSNRWSETNTVDLNSTGDINFSGLPTSSSGLSTGDLYLQSGGVPGGDYQIMVKA